MSLLKLGKIVVKKKVIATDIIELAAAVAVAGGTVIYIVKEALEKSREYKEQSNEHKEDV